MGDYYTEDLSRLNGQPKRTIGDYVERNGILVPRRFGSFDEAEKSGLIFVARSEMTQDHNGASNLFPSKIFTPEFREKHGISSDEELREYFLRGEPTRYGVEMYCEYLGLDYNNFLDEISFSLWEYIDGQNVVVVADSAIQDRYHIMMRGIYDEDANYLEEGGGYIICDGDDITFRINDETDTKEIRDWIDFYKGVRKLDRFDPNHCPIMELRKSSEGKRYFLQYHRTRDFSATSFELDREPEDGEIEAMFVRGCTKDEKGERLSARVFYMDEDYVVSDREEASFGAKRDDIFDEIMGRRRDLNLIRRRYRLEPVLSGNASHSFRSELFKPRISAVVQPFSLFSSDEWSHFVHNGGTVDLRVVADGKKAYIKRC